MPVDGAVLAVGEGEAAQLLALDVKAKLVEVGGEVEAVEDRRGAPDLARVLHPRIGAVVDEGDALVRGEVRADARKGAVEHGTVVGSDAVRLAVRGACVCVHRSFLHARRGRGDESAAAAAGEHRLALEPFLDAAARLHVDRGEGAGETGRMRILLHRHRLGEVDWHRVHQRMRPHPGLARRAVHVHPDLAARPRGAEASHVDAAALRAAVAAHRRVARDRHPRHLPERSLDVAGVERVELAPGDHDRLHAVRAHPLLLRHRRRRHHHARKLGHLVRRRPHARRNHRGEKRQQHSRVHFHNAHFSRRERSAS